VAHEALLHQWNRAADQLTEEHEDLEIQTRLRQDLELRRTKGWLIPTGGRLKEAEEYLVRYGNEVEEDIRILIRESLKGARDEPAQRFPPTQRTPRDETSQRRTAQGLRRRRIDLNRVRVFVSSPSDVLRERDIIDRVVSRLNNEYAGLAHLETIRWESQPFRADQLFAAQLPVPSDSDIVIGILVAYRHQAARVRKNAQRRALPERCCI
jgi:hypothetical protein